MTRAEMIALALASPSAAFREELSFLVHGVDDREYAYDELSAVFDIEERAEGREGNRALLLAAREVLIAIGFYRPMSHAEEQSTYVTRGNVWAFKRRGTPFICDDPAELWQWPNEGRFAQ